MVRTPDGRDAAALSDQDRTAKLSTLSANLLGLEREECALIESLHGSLMPRVDCDARAYLGIAGPAPRQL